MSHNRGEPAFHPKLALRFHSDLDVDNVKVNGRMRLWETRDGPGGDAKTISFFFPYPMYEDSKEAVVVYFSVNRRRPSTSSNYTFVCECTAVGSNLTLQRNNIARVESAVSIETRLQVTMQAEPFPVLYDNKTADILSTNNPQTITTSQLLEHGYMVTKTVYFQNFAQQMVDSLVADFSMIDEVDGRQIMCVDSVTVDSVVQSAGSSCDKLVHSQNRWKSSPQIDEINTNHTARVLTFKVQINSIDAGETSIISIGALYFPTSFPDTETGAHYFLSNVNLRYGDEVFLPLYYQNPAYSMSGQTNVTFVLEELGPKQADEKSLPYWMIIVPIIVGILLFAIMVFVFKKCGFFRRNRFIDVGEPLSAQGSGAADDADDYDSDDDE